MGVYIMGMEMPKPGVYTCELGVLDDNTAVLTIYTPINEPQKSYTLIPVPPHGRSGDMDALLNRIANDAIWKHDAMNEYDSGIRTGARTIMRLIRNAPTIIEAEGGET